MSAGLCPVVTNVGGNAAVLGEALRHRLVPPNDAEGLAIAWQNALSDQARRESDGGVARARVIESFALEAMVRSYERLYRRDTT
jgi:glycosyltransferase involved in cell wall biosynthesis